MDADKNIIRRKIAAFKSNRKQKAKIQKIDILKEKSPKLRYSRIEPLNPEARSERGSVSRSKVRFFERRPLASSSFAQVSCCGLQTRAPENGLPRKSCNMRYTAYRCGPISRVARMSKRPLSSEVVSLTRDGGFMGSVHLQHWTRIVAMNLRNAPLSAIASWSAVAGGEWG
jgi:hypothetical protein